MDLDRIKRIAVAAAYQGGEVLRSRFGGALHVKKKGVIDLVTEADVEAEKQIIKTVRSAFPDHGFLAEESGEIAPAAENCWIIDPLDGTTNFAHQLPLFCTSIAFAHRGEILCGVILAPMTGELFAACAGNGATLNGNPISVSGTRTLEESLLVTGFPYNVREIMPDVMTRMASCLSSAQGVRRLGAAALDLCYVACGRFEAFWEQNLKPWDAAAGWLIATEAGAVVSDFSGRPFHLASPELLATNGQIHSNMLALLQR